MANLQKRGWVPNRTEDFISRVAQEVAATDSATTAARLEVLATENEAIHLKHCFNLNPATNIMNPRAAALLSRGLSERPSLGYPRDKYETGLEAVEEIEAITAALCAEIFNAKYAEIRVPSGTIANLYGFMATCKPGDTIIAPPANIGGHITHHAAGCAGLYGLNTVAAPVDPDGYTLDIDALRTLAAAVKPTLITVGGSLNLFEHNVSAVREIADDVGARVMFDAAHQCGIIAGKVWKNPLLEGAHLMTMSTYKSLGGPAGGLILSNDASITERLDSIAFPGMTANFDAGKSAALAMTMLDWRDFGTAYAAAMITTAKAFAEALDAAGIPVFAKARGFTTSHQFAVEAARFGGGQTAAKALRKAGFLSCGIGLPIAQVRGDMNGLRIGTPELVRWGITPDNARTLAALVANALTRPAPEVLASEVAALRKGFNRLHFIHA